MENVAKAVNEAIKALFNIDVVAEIARPASEFGDFATNAALHVAKQLGQNPREAAQKIVDYLSQNQPDWLSEATVAGPGFINFKVSDQVLLEILGEIQDKGDDFGKSTGFGGQNVIVEYLDPNLLKELHIGHAYSGTIGDAIACLFENAGATVHRVTYQGDVGLHIAKALYGILGRINNDAGQLAQIAEAERPRFLGETYVDGATAYESDEAAKQAIVELNKKVYDASDALVNEVYKITTSWSLAYFSDFYAAFNFSPFEKNYMESAVAIRGVGLVKEHITDGVFEESQAAVIFPGEKYGLHTRVFINSQGLPTYEAKDLGNAMLKWDDYNYDRSVIITAEEQTEYFKVMLKALEQFAPDQANRTTHIAHGMVKLSTGKMASRTGQVVRALDLLEAAENGARELAASNEAPIHDTALAAIKYAFLKNRIGGDVIYDVKESLSLEGNSGPYLQYAFARARSIINKSTAEALMPGDLQPDERALMVKVSEFSEVVQAAVSQMAPHLICTYLYDLAQQFNRFYEKNRIIGDPREAQRLGLITAYGTVLKNGLSVLRIPAPDHM